MGKYIVDSASVFRQWRKRKTLLNFVADRYKKMGHRITIGTSHSGMIQSLLISKQWIFRETTGQETNCGRTKETKNLRNSVVIGRKIAYFEFSF